MSWQDIDDLLVLRAFVILGTVLVMQVSTAVGLM